MGRWCVTAGTALVLTAALLLIPGRDDPSNDPANPEHAIAVEASTVTPPLTVSAELPGPTAAAGSPVSTAQPAAADPYTVLATGTAVPYRVCSRTEQWQRPGMTDMLRVFTDPRFGDGRRPFPINYALYLSQFFVVRYPTAISANKERVAFSGRWAALNGQTDTTYFCDYPALYEGMTRNGAAFQSLWLIAHHVVEMGRQGGRLVVRVEAAPGTFEEVVFPYPPQRADNLSQSFLNAELVQIIDGAGVQRYEERSGAAGSVTWQADAAGQLQFAVVWGQPPNGAAVLPVSDGSDPLRLRLFAASWTAGAGELLVTAENGAEVLRRSWNAAQDPWDILATLELPPGRYGLGSNLAGGFVVLRDDVAVP